MSTFLTADINNGVQMISKILTRDLTEIPEDIFYSSLKNWEDDDDQFFAKVSKEMFARIKGEYGIS